jgi:hypothetical protein
MFKVLKDKKAKHYYFKIICVIMSDETYIDLPNPIEYFVSEW